ncbi:hypothetical protein [Psychroserpens luteolus]|uniref:hypothetical protein n=1 Tax=Psychroserpens luteolus TaxID=2855840 RepID=UPI001E59115F|nr:hypothetical protein [Psychroserpens luteolus]MCD2260471.1 hypothetical protein [Psychroserpens luteolus]
MSLLKGLAHIIAVVCLTIVTQVGGIIWILSSITAIRYKKKKRYVFPVIYLAFNLLIVPPIAKYFGREQLPIISSHLKPKNYIYPLLFRNYVDPELKQLLEHTAEDLKYHPMVITYLDANFPFFDGFPLLPHLSHNDGKKIDISFQYLDNDGKPTNKKPSVSGYGVYVKENGTYSTKCRDQGYWQYNFPKYLTFGTINDLELDKNNTAILIQKLLEHPKSQKLFIEPYLKDALSLNHYSKIRFHGCQAVRHDDHIHLQIR